MSDDPSRRFDRLPPTDAAHPAAGEAAPPSRASVLAWWDDRFGVEPAVFDGYTFWERGAGKVWAFHGDLPSPVRVQGLGMHVLRTGGEHWKPTTNAVQRFGGHATRNVLVLPAEDAAAFVRGEDRAVEWGGDWGYLVVAREVAGDPAPIGVGLYTRGTLRSQVPKGRRRSL